MLFPINSRCTSLEGFAVLILDIRCANKKKMGRKILLGMKLQDQGSSSVKRTNTSGWRFKFVRQCKLNFE